MDDKKDSNEQQPTELPNKAVDMLYEAMVFWHKEGVKLIKQLHTKLNEEGAGREAANIARLWKGVDDRWIDIAAKLAPYQSSKLSNIQITKTETKRFVIEAPRVITDKKEWLNLVDEEQKLLPKPVVVSQPMNGHGDDIDELEYEEINE